jgi:two-component system nitrogen regulation response regulator NtrX
LASTGTEALQQMHCHLPDVVVLDLQMPGLDGADTLKEIRKAWGAIPVILLTSYPESELMMRALEESPFMVLVKPCATARLVEAVRTAVVSQKPLRGKGNAASPLSVL